MFSVGPQGSEDGPRYFADVKAKVIFGIAIHRFKNKKAILNNMKELDFEFEIGKLSREDYDRLRQDYLAQAQETLQAMDHLRVREEIEQMIENEVRSRRRVP